MERIARIDRNTQVPRDRWGGKSIQVLEDFGAHLAQDLNMPKALAELWTLMKDGDIPDGEKLSVIGEMDRVFGLELLAEQDRSLDAGIEALITERNEARKAKNFARSDEIRDLLKNQGIILEDGPQGTRWKRG
jgi:cysteinyl-tRNA synthetase